MKKKKTYFPVKENFTLISFLHCIDSLKENSKWCKHSQGIRVLCKRELLSTPCCQLNTEWELLLSRLSRYTHCRNSLAVLQQPLSMWELFIRKESNKKFQSISTVETNGDAFYSQRAHAHSAWVWRSGDEPMYEILVINGHVTWNDKALFPTQCILSPQSWGLEFSHGFVCGSADCQQTMNPLIELKTFQSPKGWVWLCKQ